MYDSVLRLQMPESVKTIGFADDLAVVVVAKHLEEIEVNANGAIATIRAWMSGVGLRLADHKTEVVLVSSRKISETITLSIGSCDIVSKPSLRYLGVQIDSKLRFDDHVKIVSQKASDVCNALTRIMPNIGGPKQSRRKLLSNVMVSILLYGAPIWSNAMETKSYVRQMSAVYRRSALRVARAFRTVSYDAVCVISSMLPIDLLVDERAR